MHVLHVQFALLCAAPAPVLYLLLKDVKCRLYITKERLYLYILVAK